MVLYSRILLFLTVFAIAIHFENVGYRLEMSVFHLLLKGAGYIAFIQTETLLTGETNCMVMVMFSLELEAGRIPALQIDLPNQAGLGKRGQSAVKS